MSVTLDLVCEDCRVSLWAGQRDYLYIGSPEKVQLLAAFILEHQGHALRLVTDQAEPYCEWPCLNVAEGKDRVAECLPVRTTKEERRVMLHALGYETRNGVRRRAGSRNYYNTPESGPTKELWQGLEQKGLAREYQANFFEVTPAGEAEL